MTTPIPDCALCHSPGGELVWQNDDLRVVLVDEPELPGFTRVISQHHVREMSDLPGAKKQAFMRAIFFVEDTLKETYRPDKINLASLGNQTPHLHWHVIARWQDDPWFPDSVWSVRTSAQSDGKRHWPSRCSQLTALKHEYVQRLRTGLESL